MTSKDIQAERWVWVFIVAAAITRLFFTYDRSILALNSPHDEFWYIQTAARYIWGGGNDGYNQMTIIHLPIYSVWLDFLHFLHIPARFGIDLGWLLASGYLAYAFLRLTSMKWLTGMIFTFLAFHPYTISIFDRALAETFLAVVCAAVIAAGVELWNCRDSEAGIRRIVALTVFIFGFAIAFHARKEGVVIMAPLLVLVCWSFLDRQRWWSGIGRKKLAIPLLVMPILFTVLLGITLSAGNYLKWGIFARHELSAPGFQRAIAALNSIDVGRTPREFTVTKKVLAQAYRVSPTLSELQSFMESGIGTMWVGISSQNTGLPGEIGNGWFFWALRDVAAEAGWHKNAKFADNKYAAIADELENAFATGQLKKRGVVFSSFLDPDYGKWLPYLPRSILNISKLVALPRLADLDLPSDTATPDQLGKYIHITGRRTESADAGRVSGVNGWVKTSLSMMVGLGTKDATFSWTNLSKLQRPDVPGAYGFSASADGNELPTELHFRSADGESASVALRTLKAQATAITEGEVRAELGIDSLTYSQYPKFFKADKWLSKLCVAYQIMGYMFCVASIWSVLLLGIRKRQLSGMTLIFGIMIILIIVRVVLFSVVDASSYSAMQARYILPIIPAFACMGALGIALLSQNWKSSEGA